MNSKVLRFANVAAIIATIVVNALANILPINGLDTGTISDSFPVRFVPAGYVFSIWGLIYLGLSAFAIYQALPKQANNPAVAKIGWWFVASCGFNSAWIFAWHYLQFPLTIVLIVGLLVSLIMIYRQLSSIRAEASSADRWLIHTPFSIYLGWATVATIANATIALYDAGWRGGPLSDSVWTVILLAIGVCLAAFITLRQRDIAYNGVLLWAFIGIAVKQAAFPLVMNAAIVAAVAIALLIGLALIRSLPTQRRKAMA
ncbi:tryptophan-rich sensory protein [Herpetosiphon gulosus]|uniref:Tryptophan-rich sensory protein n=1 Tax=Herpetosiphon gulosus TaxID=1973496 RepID=A0ABP9X547_9CHLR